MMADLLQENRTSIHPTLVCFAKDRVEGFVHFQSHKSEPKCVAICEFEPLDLIFRGASLLQEHGTEAHQPGSPFQVGSEYNNYLLSAEDIDRKGYVENAFTAEEILAELADHVLEDTLLHLNFLHVNVKESDL